MQFWAQTVLEEICLADGQLTQKTIEGLRRIVRVVESSELYQFCTAENENFADQLSTCSDLESLGEIINDIAQANGLDGFQLCLLKQGFGGYFRKKMMASFNSAWIDEYVAKNFRYIDPLMAQAEKSDKPFFFADCSINSPIVADFWQKAESYGVGRNGFCFPVQTSCDSRIVVCFSTTQDDESVREMAKWNGYDLQILSRLATEAFCFLARPDTSYHKELGVHELKFLHAVSTSEDPEVVMSFNPIYGSNRSFQKSIIEKLDVPSIYQAIALANANGWLNDLPFDKKEVVHIGDNPGIVMIG